MKYALGHSDIMMLKFVKNRLQVILNHFPRDFIPVDKLLQEPNFIARDVLTAVDVIFDEENFT